MNDNDQAISLHNFISDQKALFEKHFRAAGKDVRNLTKQEHEIRGAQDSDRMWALFMAFHTALTDFVIDQGIKDDKVKAQVFIDIGLRMFLDTMHEAVMAAEAKKNQKPPKPVILLDS